MQKCSKCEESLPLSSGYHRAGNTKTGYHTVCKVCRKAVTDKWYSARHSDPTKLAERKALQEAAANLLAEGKLRCWACGEPKLLREFPARSETKGHGKSNRCRACNLRAVTDHRDGLDPEVRKARRAVANGRRRAGTSYAPQDAEYAQILRHDPCSYCGTQMEHVDHIVPIALGGDGSWLNLTAACSPCNYSKQAKPLLVWLAGCPVS